MAKFRVVNPTEEVEVEQCQPRVATKGDAGLSHTGGRREVSINHTAHMLEEKDLLVTYPSGDKEIYKPAEFKEAFVATDGSTFDENDWLVAPPTEAPAEAVVEEKKGKSKK